MALPARRSCAARPHGPDRWTGDSTDAVRATAYRQDRILLHDLAPLAASRGHRVVYASFWQSPVTPLAMLLHALEESLRQGRWSDRPRTGAIALAPRLALSASLPGLEGSTEIDLTALDGEPPGELLLYLDDLLGRVASERRPTHG